MNTSQEIPVRNIFAECFSIESNLMNGIQNKLIIMNSSHQILDKYGIPNTQYLDSLMVVRVLVQRVICSAQLHFTRRCILNIRGNAK